MWKICLVAQSVLSSKWIAPSLAYLECLYSFCWTFKIPPMVTIIMFRVYPQKGQIKKDIYIIDLHRVSQAKAMKKLKKAENSAEKSKVAPASNGSPSSMVGEPDERDKTRSFKSHDLDGLPWEALPFVDGGYKGAHSYTVNIEGAGTWMKSMRSRAQSTCHVRSPTLSGGLSSNLYIKMYSWTHVWTHMWKCFCLYTYVIYIYIFYIHICIYLKM